MRFLAIEHQLPSRQVTNAEVLERVRSESARHLSAPELDALQTLTESCFASTGTQVRYFRAEDETAVDLTVSAGVRALRKSGLAPTDIDLVMYVGIGRGVLEPASANIYQDLLGLRNATAFDVLDACASWLRAVHIARVFLETGTYRNIMIVNAEFVGREAHRYELKSVGEFAHWHPSATIGEAAAVTIVAGSDDPAAPDDFEVEFRTWGEARDLCFIPLPNVDGYFGKEIDPKYGIEPLQFVSFGMRLMDFGASKLIEHYRASPQFKEFDPELVFGHAASNGMSRYVAREVGLDEEKTQLFHHRFANTVSSSLPLALSTALDEGTLVPGARLLLMVASAGVTTSLATLTYRN